MRGYLRRICTSFPILLLLVGLAASTGHFAVVGVARQDPLSSDVYAFRVNLSDIGVVPTYVVAIDSSRFLVVGSKAGSNVVAVVKVVDPYSDVVVEDIYPLTGPPMSIATDGYPTSRVAIGTSKGEILLLNIERGRVTRHVYSVLGADFYVNNLFLAKSSGGGVKVIALVSEGAPRTYPCLSCHVYVLDEEGRGLLRIGPRVGNATTTCPGLEGVEVQHVTPLKIHEASGYYWDASNVLLTYIPPLTKLVFNVTYLDLNTSMVRPLRDVLVEARLTYLEIGLIVVYGVNTDASGVARVPVPRERGYTLLVDLLIRDVNGNVVWQYNYTHHPWDPWPEEVLLPPAVLTTTLLDTRPATRVYATPPFLRTAVSLLDLSNAPSSCTRRAEAKFTITPSARDLAYLRGFTSYGDKLTYVDPDSGYLEIATTTTTEGELRVLSLTRDYVGYGAGIVSASTYSGGDYVIVGLSDGRIRVYEPLGGGYRLIYIYNMGSRLLNLVTTPYIEGYVYTAISTMGVQVFRIDPFNLPIFRNLTYLNLAAPEYVHGDVAGDLTTIVLAGSNNLIVVRNVDVAVRNRFVLTLEDVIGRDVELVIKAPGGENLTGSLLVFEYPGGSTTKTLHGDVVVLNNILPRVTYRLSIRPVYDYIYPCRVTFTIGGNFKLVILGVENASYTVEQAPYRVVLNLSYVMYNITLRVVDALSGPTLVAPIDILVDGAPVVTKSVDGLHQFRLLYGRHTLTIKPSTGYEGAYYEYSLDMLTNRDQEIRVELQRVEHVINITVIDEFGALISPVNASLTGPLDALSQRVELFTIEPPPRSITTRLPYGEYVLTLKPLNESIYKPLTMRLEVTRSQSIIATLQRVRYNVTVRFASTMPVICRFNVYANNTLVASSVGAEGAIIQLPYGVFTLNATPVKEDEYKCLASKPITTRVEGDVNITIPVDRRTYRLKIVALEGETPVGNVEIRAYSVETGALVSTSITGDDGSASMELPFGIYRVMLVHPRYVKTELITAVDSDRSVTVYLNPTIWTLLSRFTPVIATLIGILVLILVIRKVRSIITKRISGETF